MPRKANKRQKTKKTQPEAADVDATNPSRPNVITRRGRHGRLQEIIGLPLEILTMILCHLSSSDILRISRLNKAFHGFLMSKHSEPIWKAARANVVGLPELPDDMNEVEYANLLFSNHCMICFRGGSIISWERRERTCKQCIFGAEEGGKTDRRKETLKAYQTLSSYGFHSDEFLLDDLVSVPVKGFKPLAVVRRDHRSLKASLVRNFVRKYSALSEGRQEAFRREHASRAEKMRQVNRRLRIWYDAMQAKRWLELKAERAKRKQQIIQRLRDMDWGYELDSLSDEQWKGFDKLHAVNQPKALTDRMWKTAEPEVVEWLRDRERERRGRLKDVAVRNRLLILQQYVNEVEPENGIYPSPMEIAVLPAVRKLIDVDHDDPRTVDRAAFEALKPQMDAYAATWEEDNKWILGDKVSKDGVRGSKDPLDLAVGQYWSCSNSFHRTWHMMTYPTVLAHRCENVGRDAFAEALPKTHDKATLHYQDTVADTLGHWGMLLPKKLYCRTKCVKALAGVMGLDPRTATPDDMDASQERVKVIRDPTSKLRENYRVMSWRTAITTIHCPLDPERDNGIRGACGTEGCPSPLDWTLASPEEAKACRELEASDTAATKRFRERNRTWRCGICLDPIHVLDERGHWIVIRLGTRKQIEQHVERKHGLTDKQAVERAIVCWPHSVYAAILKPIWIFPNKQQGVKTLIKEGRARRSNLPRTVAPDPRHVRNQSKQGVER